jgi:hypothetical protein
LNGTEQRKINELLASLVKVCDSYGLLAAASNKADFDTQDGIDKATMAARLEKLRQTAVELEVRLRGLK